MLSKKSIETELLPLVLNGWVILVSRRSLGRTWFECWWTKRMFFNNVKKFTNSKIQENRTGGSNTLKFVNPSATFWRLRIRWEFVVSQRPNYKALMQIRDGKCLSELFINTNTQILYTRAGVDFLPHNYKKGDGGFLI